MCPAADDDDPPGVCCDDLLMKPVCQQEMTDVVHRKLQFDAVRMAQLRQRHDPGIENQHVDGTIHRGDLVSRGDDARQIRQLDNQRGRLPLDRAQASLAFLPCVPHQ